MGRVATALLLVTLAVSLAILSPPAAAVDMHASITAAPLISVADATVDSGQPDSPLGSDTHLKAGYNSRPLGIQRALVRFDLGLPAGAVVDSARLELYLDSASGASSVGISACQVLSSWSEASVTWNSKPTAGSTCAMAEVGSNRAWVSWNVTDIARAWAAGSNYGLQLSGAEGSVNAVRVFFSREYGEDAKPRLYLTYSTPTPTRTPTSTPTASPSPSSAPTAILYAAASAYPGGQAWVSGHGWPAGQAVALELVRVSQKTSCGSGTAAADGTLKTMCAVPSGYAAGNVVVRGEAAGGITGQAQMAVLPGPVLTLEPASGKPGTKVAFALTGWLPGASLRLDYAGAAVLGPLPVAGSAYSGTFLVPADRPSPLGSTCTVRASMLVLGHTLATVDAAFQSLTTSPILPYSLSPIALPGGRLAPGQVFSVTGRISPVPGESPQDLHLAALWQDDEGHIWPVGQASIGPGGAYSVSVRAPTILGGDARPVAYQGDLLKLSLSAQDRAGVISTQVIIPQQDPSYLWVRPYDAETGQPIEALVSHYPMPETTRGPMDYEFFQFQTQVSDYASDIRTPSMQQALETYETNRLLCGLDSDVTRWSVNGANFVPQHPEDPFVQPQDFVALQLKGSQWTELPAQPGGAGLSRAASEVLPYRVPSAYAAGVAASPTPGRTRYIVLVDGLKGGYSYNGEGKVYQFYIWYHPATGWEDVLGNPIPMPIEVPMVKFSSGVLQAYVALSGASWSGGAWYLADLRGIAMYGTLGRIALAEDRDNPWKLQDVRLIYNGHDLGSFEKQTSEGGMDCEGEWHKGYVQWARYLPLPTADLVEPNVSGFSIGIRLKTVQGPQYEQYWDVYLSPIPAWYRNAIYKNRQYHPFDDWAHWKGGIFHGELYPPGEAKSNLDFTLDQIGEKKNSAAASSILETKMAAGAVDWYETKQSGVLSSMALNEPGKNVPTVATAPGDTPLSWSSAGDETIINTGLLLVGSTKWGLPGIAELSVSMYLQFDAHLEHQGSIQVSPQGDTLTSLYVHPYAMITDLVEGKLSILLDLGSASWGTAPSLGLGLPVYFVNGGLDDSAICFYYGLKARVKWRALVVHGCEQTVLLGPGHLPNSPLCHDPGLPSICSSAAASDNCGGEENPPLPAIATDGLGHTQALWVDASGQVVAASYSGGAWSAALPLSRGSGGDSPDLAYYAPDRAVAAWTEVPPEAGLLPTSTLTDALRSMHIVYSLWDGQSWSAPAGLTSLSTGDRNVHLAACPATESGCPAGGAVTAVWVHDAVGSLVERQFRIHSATFSGASSAWSTPAPVDPTSTASDTGPDVAYRSGKPLVAWVRDRDRSLLTVQDRRIALRTLDGISPVTQPASLPGGVLELDLEAKGAMALLAFTATDSDTAVLGNGSYLYYGTQDCPTCPWTSEMLLDSTGRAMRAEGPVATLDSDGRGTITFRHLGIGATANELARSVRGDAGAQTIALRDPIPEGLPVGVRTGTGELAQVEVGSGRHDPRFLTVDGAVYWDNAATYDPLSDSILLLTTRVKAAAQASAAADVSASGAVRLLAVAEDSPLSFAGVPRQPEFTVTALDARPRHPQPGQTAVLTASIQNRGAAWSGGGRAGLEINATWDQPAGLGQTAGSAQLYSLGAGQTVAVTMTLTPPAAGYDWRHTLYITANPRQGVAEPLGSDNVMTTTVGGIPSPGGLSASARPGEPVAWLHWDAVDDPRVVGYRVYRADDGGPKRPVGSSFVPGWLELNSEVGHSYRYTVTSFTVDGLESPPSDGVNLRVKGTIVCLPLVER